MKQANTSERQSPQLIPQRRPLLPHVNVEDPKSSFEPIAGSRIEQEL
jgi:hypothetical protein